MPLLTEDSGDDDSATGDDEISGVFVFELTISDLKGISG